MAKPDIVSKSRFHGRKGVLDRGLFEVTGVEALDKAFRDFDDKTKKKHLRKGTRAAAKVVQQDAIALVPHDTGALEKSLKVRALPRSRKSQGHGVHTGVSRNIREAQKNTLGAIAEGFEAFAGGSTFYGTFVELGTQKMEKDPFLRPALYSNGPALMKALQKAMRESITEAAR